MVEVFFFFLVFATETVFVGSMSPNLVGEFIAIHGAIVLKGRWKNTVEGGKDRGGLEDAPW